MKTVKIVTIGASAGGVKALQDFFSALPPEPLEVAFVIIMHMSKSSRVDYGLIYGQKFSGEILEIFDKMEIKSGNAYFAPSGYHVLIEKDGCFALTQDEPVNFARPSIDVTFSSVSEARGRNCCGVLMTGSNADGARGLKDLASRGGFTLVQDPKVAEYPTMPEAALDLFKPNAVLPVPEIVAKIVNWAREE
jgi:two-component system chemotaxis response regulator CheB